MASIQDLSSQRFGKLVVVSFAGVVRKKTLWNCRCDCGECRVVGATNLKSGNTKSCGCGIAIAASLRRTTHGKSRSPEHRSYYAIRDRCLNHRCKAYYRYGGRGITICPEWLGPGGFERFYADMGPRPGPNMSVERKDNNKGYSPDNCVWATDEEQNNNKRTNIIVRRRGKTMTLKQACAAEGMPYASIRWRLTQGWHVDMAFDTPIRGR
jgi:hypothetical protein